MEVAIVALNILAAAGGFAASAFWFKASKTAFPSFGSMLPAARSTEQSKEKYDK